MLSAIRRTAAARWPRAESSPSPQSGEGGRAQASGRVGLAHQCTSVPTRLALGYRLRASHPPRKRGGMMGHCPAQHLTSISQRSAARRLGFRAAGVARIPFSVSLFRGDGAPGGARELARLPSPACEAGVSRQDSGTLSFGGMGVPGRAGPCEEPCASRRSNAATLSGAAPRSVIRRRLRRRPR